jgi:N-acetylneuraminic acid mutarotase
MKTHFLTISLILQTIIGLGQWSQQESLPSVGRNGAAGFSIGSKGYLGIGRNSTIPYVYYHDFWEYDPSNDTWTQKADFPGGERFMAVAFSIGSKGYICCGGGGQPGGLVWYADLWEYDPAADTWTQKADFPGGGRPGAAGFSLDNKGYLGTGAITNDFWEYDPTSNMWTQKADFPGTSRIWAVGFSNGSKGYLGTGQRISDMGYLKDFWEYNPTNDSWTRKADFGGGLRSLAVGFSIDSKGYIGTGLNEQFIYNDFWQYNDTTNSWTQKPDFPGIERNAAVGFSIGSKGYIGTGMDYLYRLWNDFYEYDPLITNIVEKNLNSLVTLFPNPAGEFIEISAPQIGIIEFSDLQGHIFKSLQTFSLKTKIDLTNLLPGFYIIKVKSEQGIAIKKMIKQ